LRRFRLFLAASVLLALAALLVACGSDDDNGGGGGEDPQTVLDQTFSGDADKIESADLSLSLSGSGQGESFDIELSGPFENQGEGEVPKFDLTARVDTSDTDFEGGLISTGDAAFVNYQGSTYEVEQSLFDRFKQSIEQSAGQQEENQQSADELLKQLGIDDPTSLLTNLSNEGTADVEGTETDHISGDLDVDRVVDAVQNLIGSASLLGQFGGDTSDLPSSEDLDQIRDAVKEAHFDVYSGVDDHILRRFTAVLGIDPPDGSGSIDLDLDLTLAGVNEPQTIEAPSGAKPFRQLLDELGVDPSAIAALGLLSQGGSSGGGILTPEGGGEGGVPTVPGGGATGGGASAAQLQKYLQCLLTSGDPASCESLIK
jgi:hypothetical protein